MLTKNAPNLGFNTISYSSNRSTHVRFELNKFIYLSIHLSIYLEEVGTRIDVTTKDTVVLMLYVFSQPLIGPANTTILPDQSEASKKHITLAQQYHLSLRQF